MRAKCERCSRAAARRCTCSAWCSPWWPISQSIGLFAPVLFGLAFIHYLLAELEVLRREPIDATAAPQ